MNRALQAVNAWVDQRQTRERALLLLVVLGLIYALAQLIWLGPYQQQRAELSRQISEIETRRGANQTALKTLLNQTQANRNGPLRGQIAALKLQLVSEQRELSAISQGMVSADSLPRVLEDVLLRTGQLELQRLTALPVQELPLTATDAEGQPLSAGVYKHRVQLELEGGYLQLVNYLEALEALPWGFNWEQLRYRVAQFPNATIELQVYTLTTEEGLFGEA